VIYLRIIQNYEISWPAEWLLGFGGTFKVIELTMNNRFIISRFLFETLSEPLNEYGVTDDLINSVPTWRSWYSALAGRCSVRLPTSANNFSLLQNTGTYSGVHSASYIMSTGGFPSPRGRVTGAWNWLLISFSYRDCSVSATCLRDLKKGNFSFFDVVIGFGLAIYCDL